MSNKSWNIIHNIFQLNNNMFGLDEHDIQPYMKFQDNTYALWSTDVDFWPFDLWL